MTPYNKQMLSRLIRSTGDVSQRYRHGVILNRAISTFCGIGFDRRLGAMMLDRAAFCRATGDWAAARRYVGLARDYRLSA